jgi:hypothetical protein
VDVAAHHTTRHRQSRRDTCYATLAMSIYRHLS